MRLFLSDLTGGCPAFNREESTRSANVAGASSEDVGLATVTMELAGFSMALNAQIPPYKINLR